MFTRDRLVADLSEQHGVLFTNPRGELLVSPALPERAELVRLGNSWIIRTAAVACVTAVPTTTAPAYLWNGENVGGKSYVIDALGWICTTSAGSRSMFALLACLNQTPVSAAPATADPLAIATLGGRAYSGLAAMGHAATVVDDNWVPIGQTGNTAPLGSTAGRATVGLTVWQPIQGTIIVPPQYLLNLACIAVNTTAAGQFAVLYHEVQLSATL